MSENPFDQLAHQVETEWSTAGGHVDAFTEIATHALRNFQYDWSQEKFDAHLADWLLSSHSLPDQVNVHNTFGQPPVTLFNNGRFVVDVYIWMGCDTSIHSHGFRGAFKLLHGRSLHETFSVRPVKKIASDVSLTSLGNPTLEILRAGDLRTIFPGRDLTHRVIHLDEPTVTLCVKTINETSLRQWHHFANGLAIQKRHLDPGLIKKVYYFQYLSSQDPPAAVEFLERLLITEDISTTMNLCEEISQDGYDLSPHVTHAILEKVYEKYGATEWFRLYEECATNPPAYLEFAHSHHGLSRLAAHLVNEKKAWSEVRDFFESLQSKSVSKKEIEAALTSLIDDENPNAPLQRSAMHSFLEA